MQTQEMDLNAETVKAAARMDELYEKYAKHLLKREEADTLANIAGKHLKAVQLNLADQIFRGERAKNTLLPVVPVPDAKKLTAAK